MTSIHLPDPVAHPHLTVDDILSMSVGDRSSYDVQLFATKWWDYKFITSAEATFLYVDAFGRQARRIYSRDIDSTRAQYIKVITGDALKERLLKDETQAKRAFSSFWRGRQVADALGMPYDDYIWTALDMRMKYWNGVKVVDAKGRTRTKTPTPNQLYSEMIVEKVVERWNELQDARIYYSDHSAYLPCNYVGTDFQRGYYAYLVTRAEKSTMTNVILGGMIANGQISREYLIEVLPESRLKEIDLSLVR